MQRYAPLGRAYCYSATAARSDTVAATIIAENDGVIHQLVKVEIPYGIGDAVVHTPLEHLVEVTIVQRSIVANADKVPAHDALCRGRIKCIDQFCHVRIDGSARSRKCLNRSIGMLVMTRDD